MVRVVIGEGCGRAGRSRPVSIGRPGASRVAGCDATAIAATDSRGRAQVPGVQAGPGATQCAVLLWRPGLDDPDQRRTTERSGGIVLGAGGRVPATRRPGRRRRRRDRRRERPVRGSARGRRHLADRPGGHHPRDHRPVRRGQDDDHPAADRRPDADERHGDGPRRGTRAASAARPASGSATCRSRSPCTRT